MLYVRRPTFLRVAMKIADGQIWINPTPSTRLSRFSIQSPQSQISSHPAHPTNTSTQRSELTYIQGLDHLGFHSGRLTGAQRERTSKRRFCLAMDGSQLPVMHSLAIRSSWNKLLERLETHPDEASIQTTAKSDSHDLLLSGFEALEESTKIAAIHILCTRRDVPLSVLEAFVKAQPTSVRLLTSNNNCALHLACYAQQPLEIIQCLAEADPDAILSQEAKSLRNSLHICLVFGRGLRQVIPMLIHVGGPERIGHALASKDVSSKTPLVLACESNDVTQSDFALLFQASGKENLERPLIQELSHCYSGRITRVLSSKLAKKSALFKCDPSRYCNPKRALSTAGFMLTSNLNDAYALRACWHKLVVVLGVEDESQLSTFPLLHECIRQDSSCETLFFQMILHMNPHYMCQMDSNGELPIHVAARLATNTKEWRERIEALVRGYPKGSSIANNAGELPLELLRQVSWNHMRYLVLYCPLALSKLRLSESLYAEIMAKMGPTGGQLNFIFTILKNTPTLFERHGAGVLNGT